MRLVQLPGIGLWDLDTNQPYGAAATANNNALEASYRLPRASFRNRVSNPRTLRETQSRPTEVQETVVAENDLLRVVYGEPRIGAQVANVLGYNGNWIIQLVWCWGGSLGIDSINDIAYADSTTLPAGMTVLANYTGTQVAANSTLVSAFAAQTPPVTYSDTLNKVAYTVIQATGAALTSGFNFSARIKGMKVYDPRSGLTVWSKNPALCLADFIESADYGLGKTVNDTTLIEAANWNDTTLDGKSRNTLSIALDAAREGREWIEVLRTYAEAFVVPSGGVYKIIADKPRTSVYTLSHANGRMKDVPSLTKRGLEDVPTVIWATYTDTSVIPNREGRVAVYASDDVKNGIAPWRESVVTLTGITDRAEAYRHAVTRYNKLAVNDLAIGVECFDEALQLEVGDVITFDYPPYGISNKLMQVGNVTIREPGRWSIVLNEYNDAAFSSAVLVPDDYPDTVLPNPAEPPTVASLSMVEEYYQDYGDRWFTRFRATWTAPTWYYPFIYAVRLVYVQDNSGQEVIVWSGTLADNTFVSPAVVEGLTYRIYVAVRGPVGVGTESMTERVAAARALPPTDVQNLTGAEAGGRVYLRWDPAVDLGTLRYRIKQGAVGVSWTNANDVDYVDSTSYLTQGFPAGKYDFLVKALDQFGNYSANEARATIIVLTDDSAFKALSFTPPAGWSGLAVTQYTEPDGKLYGVTDWADAVNYGHAVADDSSATGDFDDGNVASSVAMAMPHSRAMNFKGSVGQNYISVAHAAGLNVGNTHSVDVWIFPTSMAGNHCIWNHGGGWFLGIGTGSGGTARLWCTGGGIWAKESVNNVITLNAWNHVAVTNSAGTRKLYVNGVEVAYQQTNTYTATDNAVAKQIGTDGSAWFNGLISRLRLWSVALTAADLASCMEYRGTEVTTVIAAGNLVAANLKASYLINDYAQSDPNTQVVDQKGVSNGVVTGGTDWRSWDEIVSAAIEMGATYSATFEVTKTPTVISGTARTALLLATNSSGPWTELVGTSVTGVARYVKIKYYSEAGAAIYPLSAQVRVNLTPRSEFNYNTTATTDINVPRVIALNGNYSQALRILLQAKARTVGGVPVPTSLVYDQVEVSGGRGLLAGRSLRFNGQAGDGTTARSYVYVGDYSQYIFTNAPGTATDKPFSVECLTKFDTIGSVQTFISKGDGGGGGDWQFRLLANGALAVLLNDTTTGSLIRIETQTLLAPGIWYHFAATYSGSNPMTGGVKLYVNGKLEPTIASYLGGSNYVCMRGAAYPLVIGNQYIGGSYNTPVSGVIDEVRIWSDVRTEGEINAYMAAYVPIGGAEDDGLVSYWKFDEESGFTAVDTMGLHNGTLGSGSIFNGLSTYAQKWWRPYDGFDVYGFIPSTTAGAWLLAPATEFRWDYTGA